MMISYEILINSLGALSNLMQCSDVPFKAGLAIAKNIEAISKEINSYIELEKALNEKYLQKDENGEYKQNSENMYALITGLEDEYIKDRKCLDEFEVEVQIYMIRQEDLENVKMPPAHIKDILFMIE